MDTVNVFCRGGLFRCPVRPPIQGARSRSILMRPATVRTGIDPEWDAPYASKHAKPDEFWTIAGGEPSEVVVARKVAPRLFPRP